MAEAIHIEIDALFFLLLCFIAFQSRRNISQQMSRILFRNTVYGIIVTLGLDILWMLIDGRSFPGNIAMNYIVNALFLSAGVLLGGLWYLYVLETLGVVITRKLTFLILLPGAIFTVLNLLSIWTGWIFFINEGNRYIRGPLFWLQTIGALSLLFASLIHILIVLAFGKHRTDRHSILKLLSFYIIPVIGTVATLPYSGMPGTWTCASASIILIYMDDQDREIVRDSLTGLNNRKTLKTVFTEYAKQATPEKRLCLLMIDLDNFKSINDTLGHPVGDQALVATAEILTKSVSGMQAFVARYGGDEFLIMGFFSDQEALQSFKQGIRDRCETYNTEKKPPYVLCVSIGSSFYEASQSFEELVENADEALYEEKRRRKVGR